MPLMDLRGLRQTYGSSMVLDLVRFKLIIGLDLNFVYLTSWVMKRKMSWPLVLGVGEE
jgi:hypothetical protein